MINIDQKHKFLAKICSQALRISTLASYPVIRVRLWQTQQMWCTLPRTLPVIPWSQHKHRQPLPNTCPTPARGAPVSGIYRLSSDVEMSGLARFISSELQLRTLHCTDYDPEDWTLIKQRLDFLIIMSDSDGDDTRLFVAVAKTEVQSLTTDQPRQGNTASQALYHSPSQLEVLNWARFSLNIK